MVANHQQLRTGKFLFPYQPQLLRHGAVPGDQSLIVAHLQADGHTAFIAPAIFCRSKQPGGDSPVHGKKAVPAYTGDLYPMPPGAVQNISREFFRPGRHNQLPQFHHFHQHGNPVAMVLMKVGQHQCIHLFPPPAQQVAASQFPGVVQTVDPAAVDQHRAVPGQGSDAKPLAHIQHGDGVPPPGIIPGGTAQKQTQAQHSGQPRHAEAQPAFLTEKTAENKQTIAGRQPEPQPFCFRIHHRPRQRGDQSCRKEDVPGKPGNKPGRTLAQQRQQ